MKHISSWREAPILQCKGKQSRVQKFTKPVRAHCFAKLAQEIYGLNYGLLDLRKLSREQPPTLRGRFRGRLRLVLIAGVLRKKTPYFSGGCDAAPATAARSESTSWGGGEGMRIPNQSDSTHGKLHISGHQTEAPYPDLLPNELMQKTREDRKRSMRWGGIGF